MRYYQIMAEKIQNRPRHLGSYLTLRIRELGQMLSDLAQAKILIDDGGRDGESILSYAVRYGTRGTPYDDNSHLLGSLEYLNLDREFQIARLKENLETYLQYGNERHDFLRYVTSTLADVEKHQNREYATQYEMAFKMLPYAERGFQEYGYEAGNPEHEADEEYIAGKKTLAGYRLMARVFNRIGPLQADMREKLGVIEQIRAHAYGGKYRPAHGEVETLYHASAFVPEILRDGFQAERPMERAGVGNLGTQRLISFSHDLEICRTIMRAFKEIWMITHGQLTARQILGWAQAEGIDLRELWRNQEGSKPLPTDDPRKVVVLYRLWQWATKMRANPVMMSPWEVVDVMQNRTLKDIGVLACEVQLRPEDEYLLAESEFRLPADRVLSVKQVL
jgi:hypothetical protein